MHVINGCGLGELHHIVRLYDLRQLEAWQGGVHAEMKTGYEEVVGVVISAKWRMNNQVKGDFQI